MSLARAEQLLNEVERTYYTTQERHTVADVIKAALVDAIGNIRRTLDYLTHELYFRAGLAKPRSRIYFPFVHPNEPPAATLLTHDRFKPMQPLFTALQASYPKVWAVIQQCQRQSWLSDLCNARNDSFHDDLPQLGPELVFGNGMPPARTIEIGFGGILILSDGTVLDQPGTKISAEAGIPEELSHFFEIGEYIDTPNFTEGWIDRPREWLRQTKFLIDTVFACF